MVIDTEEWTPPLLSTASIQLWLAGVVAPKILENLFSSFFVPKTRRVSYLRHVVCK